MYTAMEFDGDAVHRSLDCTCQSADELILAVPTETDWQGLAVYELVQHVQLALLEEANFGLHTIIHKHLGHPPDGAKHHRDVDDEHARHELLHART